MFSEISKGETVSVSDIRKFFEKHNCSMNGEQKAESQIKELTESSSTL